MNLRYLRILSQIYHHHVTDYVTTMRYIDNEEVPVFYLSTTSFQKKVVVM
jgi:hypothetical protein